MSMYTALGMMSGTSMDGIDVALIRTDGRDELERGASMMFPYDADTRAVLLTALKDAAPLTDRTARPGSLGRAEALITDLHVRAVGQFLDEQQIDPTTIDVIGFHGQTVLHRPEIGLTVQIGDGKALAAKTGIAVVNDMRANDMVHGGQGAPLAPVYHQALSRTLAEEFAGQLPIAFVNVGGISNITIVGEDLVAFDSGPGNGLIDQWIAAHDAGSYDECGAIAARGEINAAMLEHMLTSEWFSLPPPKSLDRSDFPPLSPGALSLDDGARTLARLTAESVIRGAELLPQAPKLWIICGGGRHNRVIMSDLRELALARQSQVISAEDAGFDGDAVEAEAWAYMAVRSLAHLPLTFPGATGVREPVTGGVLQIA